MSVVKTNPALVTDNVIQAAADVPDLTLLPFSDAQVSPILKVENQAGTVTNLEIEPDGSLSVGDQTFDWLNLVGDVHIPLKVAVRPTDDDAIGIHLLDASTAGVLIVDDAGNTIANFASPHARNTVLVLSDVGLQKTPLLIAASAGGSLPALQVNLGVINKLFTLERSGALESWLVTDVAAENVSSIVPELADAVDAHWKGRVKVVASDVNGAREGMRVEADGAVARVGFLGASAVVRQPGASAAAIAAIVDPNAKAAISALQTALANLGLVTSPA